MVKQNTKSQHLATVSLVVMAAGFIATIPLQGSLWGVILQGGFEAGLVGGLADWFAVTALFRHPLGLPIPHTALLPKNREKMIAKIISMLENDLLTKESIHNKIDAFQFSEILFALAEKEMQAPAIKTNTISLIQHLIGMVDRNKLAAILAKELKQQLTSMEVKEYLPLLIDQVSARKYDEKTLDYILKEIDEWAMKDSTKYRLGGIALEMIENIKADGFMQFALRSFSNLVNEDKLGSIIQNLIQKGVDSFRDPYNLNRKTLLGHIQQKLEQLKSDEKMYEELEHFKSQLIAKWEPESKISELLAELQQKAYDFIAEPGFYDTYILPLFNKSLKGIKEDTAKVNALDTWIKNQIIGFVNQNHSQIGKLVGENLEKLDTKTLTHLIENNVGKDLQWIRVNGAVCGFLIGLVLVCIKLIF
ncbi:DUF445 domain-containing protein [Bacillus sp. BRMEA1]|uniref:DUF445 domain-containing protein n=1 Tax=Neobacillus endophyticus TaxID=2738405 RepID=UPI0015659E38|nr:DUF445 domain-containing protein [Neobacillus endophyticus]NRD78319.1 DUF445 domain-containing protein [Neobacillus endophyticus]